MLIASRDAYVRTALGVAAEGLGMRCEQASSMNDALDLRKAERFDAYLIDSELDGASGYELCRTVRDMCDSPVIMVSESHEADHAVEAFASGADDFVRFPFSMPEMRQRIRAVMRRASCPVRELEYDGAVLDHATNSIDVGNGFVQLSEIEFGLAKCIIAAGGTAVPNSTLIAQVWGRAEYASHSALKSRIHSLRSKIGHDRIRCVPGIGYRFEPEK